MLATEPRSACDNGAWTVWEGDLREPNPVRLLRREGDEFLLEIGRRDGSPAPAAVVDALVPSLRQMRGVVDGLGLCALGDAAYSVHLLRCTTTLRGFAEQLAALPETVPGLRDHTVRLCARIAGDRGPRCDPRDASCLPTQGDPSGEGARWASRPPDAPRCPPRFASTDMSSGMCQHDGESCGHWIRQPLRALEPRAVQLELLGAERCSVVRLRPSPLRVVPVGRVA